MEVTLKCLGLLILIHVSYGAFVDFLCPRVPPSPGRNSSVFFPCSGDCAHQHGAVGGTCGDPSKGDFNCYCGELTGKRYEPSLHCMKPNEDRYRRVCTIDCLCNHGATGGYCDWEKKACVCKGYDPRNTYCPVKTVEEFAWVIYKGSGKEDLGPFGMGFVGQIIPVNK